MIGAGSCFFVNLAIRDGCNVNSFSGLYFAYTCPSIACNGPSFKERMQEEYIIIKEKDVEISGSG